MPRVNALNTVYQGYEKSVLIRAVRIKISKQLFCFEIFWLSAEDQLFEYRLSRLWKAWFDLSNNKGWKIKKECGTKLKISFATDSRTNGGQKSGFSEISRKTINTKSVLLVFLSNFSNLNDFCLDLFWLTSFAYLLFGIKRTCFKQRE